MSLLAHWRSWLALVTPLLLTFIPLMGDPDMSAAMWTLYTITCESVISPFGLIWVFNCVGLGWDL